MTQGRAPRVCRLCRTRLSCPGLPCPALCLCLCANLPSVDTSHRTVCASYCPCRASSCRSRPRLRAHRQHAHSLSSTIRRPQLLPVPVPDTTRSTYISNSASCTSCRCRERRAARADVVVLHARRPSAPALISRAEHMSDSLLARPHASMSRLSARQSAGIREARQPFAARHPAAYQQHPLARRLLARRSRRCPRPPSPTRPLPSRRRAACCHAILARRMHAGEACEMAPAASCWLPSCGAQQLGTHSLSTARFSTSAAQALRYLPALAF